VQEEDILAPTAEETSRRDKSLGACMVFPSIEQKLLGFFYEDVEVDGL
jgi:hypothetical protein